jgi:hypothetical protein
LNRARLREPAAPIQRFHLRAEWRQGQGVYEDANRLRSNDENRILGRLIELLPDAIDLYDQVLWEARRAGPEKEKLVKRLGRGRVEPLLEDAIARFQSTGSFDNVEGVGYHELSST